jgi:membrane-associated phospholipid phosphatase
MPTFIDGASGALHSFAIAHSWLTPLVIWGTAGFLILCPVGFLVMFFWEWRLRPGVAGLLGLVVTQVVSHELGRLTYQARPFVALHFTPLFPHVPNNSFPSSLTAFVAVAAVIGVLAWGRLGLVFVVGMIFVGFGCVYVGVHYPSDVFVGAAIGAACGWATWMIAGGRPMTKVLSAIERHLPKRRRSMAAVRTASQPRDSVRVARGAT